MANILVVDDSPVMQRLLTLMLKRNDHEVSTVSNGREAFVYLADEGQKDGQKVDLIITDVNMPEIDGLALLQTLRADNRYKHLPIIVLTASGQEGIRRIAARGGANGFLTRPTSSWELKEIINHCLESPPPNHDDSPLASLLAPGAPK
jgi:two-component system, chemotaxis family, chemotaxis protein CheY